MTTSFVRYPQRVRNELRFRELTVLRVERISAGFQRIVLGGEALDGFTSLGFDDHTKVSLSQAVALRLRQSLRKVLSGGRAFVRSPGITRRCMMRRVASWHWISLSTMAA